ncbi:mucin-associated surface protein [Trypanosoma cruzi cruzi]|uniref:Mucin-associated surface protein (MASP) n=1 Tax=Trypanosoma cruzi TaxID=5693 RepID=A0A2V2VSI0_TRYCR|nr:mucin-associated surface protein [Trypanosoma cruzi cruzi]PWU98756.1 Mucin-associated surface protein (MASP) [Trypanosoma cruzi]
MAMMMTGRVLLVCALCVLWCGAGGGSVDALDADGKAGGSSSGGEDALGSPRPLLQEPNLSDSERNQPEHQGNASPSRAKGEVVGDDDAGKKKEDNDSNDDDDGSEDSELPPPPAIGASGKEDTKKSLITLPQVSGVGSSAGGGGGPSGNPNRSGDDVLSSSALISAPPPFIFTGGNGSQTVIGVSSTQQMEYSKESSNLFKKPAEDIPSKEHPQEKPAPNAREVSSTQRVTTKSQVVGTDTTGKDEARNGNVANDPSSKQPEQMALQKTQTQPIKVTKDPISPLPPTEKSPAPTVKAGKEGPPATTGFQTSTEQKQQGSPSQTETQPKEMKQSSTDGGGEQKGKDTVSSDSMKDAVTDNPGKTTATSIPTIDSGNTQEKEGKDDDADERPTSKEHNSSPETGNTNDALTASENTQQTVKTVTAKTNDTATNADSDGSTAVSHTTSPLLLLILVACAAAAVVAA